MRRKPESRWLGPLGLLAMLAVVSCSGDVGRAVRSITYPPSTAYVPRDDVRAAMHELSSSSLEVSRLLRVAEGGGAVDRDAVIDRLRRMELAARSVGAGGWPTNHPMISARIDVFLEDLVHARSAIEQEPPRYALAGAVTGACVYCHTPR
jgi:hypothetical protein